MDRLKAVNKGIRENNTKKKSLKILLLKTVQNQRKMSLKNLLLKTVNQK